MSVCKNCGNSICLCSTRPPVYRFDATARIAEADRIVLELATVFDDGLGTDDLMRLVDAARAYASSK